MAKTLQDIFQKKTPLEHILLRPDSYVGSVQPCRSYLHILQEEGLSIRKKQIEYVPALYKIFDEILVNAADNYQRCKSMTYLKVNIDPQIPRIGIQNNGKSIPVHMHEQYKIYIPQLIFGHLLTGSSFNDDQKRIVGGRNGYGAKLANIFNMRWTKTILNVMDKKYVTTFRTQNNYTFIQFQPDLKLFSLKQLSPDFINLLYRRVYDMAGLLPKVKISLNQKNIAIKDFSHYVDLYLQEGAQKIVQKQKHQRWNVIASFSQGEFSHISFVNSIFTSKGGSHVNYILDQIVQKLKEHIQKKNKDLHIKPHQLKSKLFLFIKSTIQNPHFESQTKQTLTSKVGMFGSKCQLSQKFIKDIIKSGICQRVVQEARLKELNTMAKKTKGGKKQRLSNMNKLDDANEAGSKNSHKCTLILTQGDSAKGFALAGLEIVGRDHYGIFPLRGKLLNVRQASNKQIMQNKQIQNIIKIMGLQIGKSYDNVNNLRYGSIMIMTDQDTDGSHIKGLLINFIHYFWSSLLKIKGFLVQFITPILKSFKGNNVLQFYSIEQYNIWKQGRQDLHLWKIKYYKGLGTSTDKQAQEYFQKLKTNTIRFYYQGQQDDKSVNLVFNKKKTNQRKQWLAQYVDDHLDYKVHQVNYTNFINKELIHFSIYDNLRSIPNLVDGLKPGQRKILFACFKRNLKSQVKVAQLIGYIAEHSVYHHGEQSLAQTIIGMAQNFVGSNNINLLQPNGQFGSRNQGGKQHASARYIFTNLSKLARVIYPQADDHILEYLQDDGHSVQPKWYIPIIPMCLVNGAEGIGTGWSTFIPCYNPRELVQYLKMKLNKGGGYFDCKSSKIEQEGQKINLHPWYKNHKNQPQKVQHNRYQSKGLYQVKDNCNTVVITQLPIRKWTKSYKKYLHQLMEQDEVVDDIREYHAKFDVNFEVDLAQGILQKWQDKLQKNLKLSSSLSTNNMVLLDKEYKIRRYGEVQPIVDQFFELRIKMYQKRKQYMLSKIQRDIDILDNKARFIYGVVNDQIVINKKKKLHICQFLLKKGFTTFSKLARIKSTKPTAKAKVQQQQQSQQQGQTRSLVRQFDYLLSMQLWNLTEQKYRQLQLSLQKKRNQYSEIKKIGLGQMWLKDLDQFERVLNEIEQKQEKQRAKLNKKAMGNHNKAKKKPKKKKDRSKSKSKEKGKRDKQKHKGKSSSKEGSINKSVNKLDVIKNDENKTKNKKDKDDDNKSEKKSKRRKKNGRNRSQSKSSTQDQSFQNMLDKIAKQMKSKKLNYDRKPCQGNYNQEQLVLHRKQTNSPQSSIIKRKYFKRRKSSSDSEYQYFDQ